MRSYRTVFNRQALEFVADADEDTYAEIEQWVNRIERAPSLLVELLEQPFQPLLARGGPVHRAAESYRPKPEAAD